MLGVAIATLSLYATWLNIQRVRACFAIWFGTNVGWCVYDAHHGLHAQSALMGIYSILAIHGWRTWSR